MRLHRVSRAAGAAKSLGVCRAAKVQACVSGAKTLVLPLEYSGPSCCQLSSSAAVDAH